MGKPRRKRQKSNVKDLVGRLKQAVAINSLDEARTSASELLRTLENQGTGAARAVREAGGVAPIVQLLDANSWQDVTIIAATLVFEMTRWYSRTLADRYEVGNARDPEREALAAESSGDPADLDTLMETLATVFRRCLKQLTDTAEETLSDPREVGSAKLPSSVRGLLFHSAEHAQRHCGQVATTVKVLATQPR